MFDAINRAEKFFQENKFRSYGKAGSPGFSSEVVNQLYPESAATGIYSGFISNHYRRDLHTLGQFVRYLGAWSGRKNLILISESWIIDGDGESDTDLEESINMRDLQTVCVFNKVAINSIDLARSTDYYGNGEMGSIKAGNFFLSPSATLASSTAGYFYKANSRDLADTVARAVSKSEHFYRIRYYTDAKGKRFRNIKVGIRGPGRIAVNADGYYPRTPILSGREVGSEENYQSADITLSLDTEWMHWAWNGWKKRRATYAVVRRAFNEDGIKLCEQIFTGELLKRKKSGKWQNIRLEKQINLTIPQGQKATRFETEVLDLITGTRVRL